MPTDVLVLMSHSLAAFANTGSLLFILLMLALPLTWWQGSRRLGILLGVAVLAVILGLAILPVRDWLGRPLEDYFQTLALPDHVDGILVLGGAEQPQIMAARAWPELNSRADRLVAFVALARRYPQARLVFSGGGAPSSDEAITEADVAADVFGLLGLAPARITYERASRNTAENARNSVALIQPQPDEIWLLVTSARHMPRAVNSFEAVGWPMRPYPVDFQTGGMEAFRFSPLDGLLTLNTFGKEWLGLIGYWLMGYTHDLLPPRRASETKP